MATRRRIASFWRNIVHSGRFERDLDAEVRAAFDLLVAEKVEAGVPFDEARRAAAIELGGVEAVKQQVRDARSGAAADALLQDVRYAARTLWRRPLFSLTAILSLGVGIAGNAVLFSLVNAYLLGNRPGIAGADRIVEVGRIDSPGDPGVYSGDGFDTFSYPNYLDYRDRQTVFEGVAAYDPIVTFGLGVGDAAVRVSGAYVSANYFEVLGVPIARGRGFLPADEQAASPATVMVISDRLWRTQFSSAVDIVGRTVHLNGRSFTVVGVTAPGFDGYTIGLESLWVPITAYPRGGDLQALQRRGSQWLMGLGRLKHGVTIEQARVEMARIAADLRREYPDDNRRHGLGVEPSGALPVIARPIVNRFVMFLFVLVGLILVIASFNVAGMLLVRGLTRSREISVRLALGAARHRLMRLLLAESVMLSLAGAVVALAGAWVASHLVERLIPPLRVNLIVDLAIDWRVMAFSLTIATLAGLACGLVPARAAARIDLASTIVRDSGHSTQRLWTRSMFVIAQVALSVLLVVCALILGRSLRHAGAIDPGFAVDGVDVVGLDLRLGGYEPAAGRVFADALMSRVQNLPGLEAVTSARVVPLTGEREGGRSWLPDEYGDERAIDASQNFVTPGYFRTLRLPLLAGRDFEPDDRAGRPAVAIVNETLARRAWPGHSPIGKRLVMGASRRPFEIVGMARDAKYRTIGEGPMPFIYVPAAQRYDSTMWILMRPTGPSAIPQLRALIHEMDPNLPILQATTLTEMSAFALFPQRVAAWLAAVVGTVGVLLAAIGVYGITAFDVSQRTREIGIRVALGAVRAEVLQMVVGHAMRLAVAGTTLGLLAAALITRLLEGMLYDVRPLDAVSFAGAAFVFVALAILASLIPARRAASVNPVDALRAE